MSVIWGCIDLSGKSVEPDMAERMRKPFLKYTIDRYAHLTVNNAMMGCGIQYITDESKNEPLPFFDDDAGIYFTADCILDNREQLMEELEIHNAAIPDGALLYAAYKRWREETPKHLLGVFSFAVYDKKKNLLMISADHTFSRSIYYCREGDRVFFATLLGPICAVRKGKQKINDRWIADYMVLKSLQHLTEPLETVYTGVYKVMRGQYILFDAENNRSINYWDPKKMPPLKLDADPEYRQYFFDLMDKVARQVTRASGQISIMLSSGYDSTTVASFVSEVLKEKGEKLYSYTHVPVDSYAGHLPRYHIPNEQEGVEEFCAMYPNISPRFVSFPEIDAQNTAQSLLDTLESPCKVLNGFGWITSYLDIVRKEGDRIALTGQFGNFTVSDGDIFIYARTILGKGRPTKAFLVLNRFARRLKYSRKKLFSAFIKGIAPNWMRRKEMRDYIESSLINDVFAKANNVYRNVLSYLVFTIGSKTQSYWRTRLLMLGPIPFSHIGEIETKMGLKYGIVIRDILRDVRVIEFCLAAPMECFIGSDTIERRMMRVYMRGRIPDRLLDDEKHRGLQSADSVERLAGRWDVIYPELERVLLSPVTLRIADEAKIRKLLIRYKTPPLSRDEDNMLVLFSAYTMGLFLLQHEAEAAD